MLFPNRKRADTLHEAALRTERVRGRGSSPLGDGRNLPRPVPFAEFHATVMEH